MISLPALIAISLALASRSTSADKLDHVDDGGGGRSKHNNTSTPIVGTVRPKEGNNPIFQEIQIIRINVVESNVRCHSGYWGPSCEQECHCFGSIACNRTSGSCPHRRCATGYIGASCNRRLMFDDDGDHHGMERRQFFNRMLVLFLLTMPLLSMILMLGLCFYLERYEFDRKANQSHNNAMKLDTPPQYSVAIASDPVIVDA